VIVFEGSFTDVVEAVGFGSVFSFSGSPMYGAAMAPGKAE
jgi:hypothetical protein